MKKKELSDLKSKSTKDLAKMLSEKKDQVSKKTMEIAGGKEKNLKVSRNLKREVAQIATLIKEKQIIESLEPKEEEKKEVKK